MTRPAVDRQRLHDLRRRRGEDDFVEVSAELPDERKPIQLSIYFFSSDEESLQGDKYHLVKEAARRADRAGFTAIWTPERHFHSFGGLYPNPAVLSSALAALTDRIQIRAGSVVLPVHHPVRVAEDWAVIDNLSHGRVGVSFASGWSPRDFVFAPDAWPDRNELMFAGIDEIRRLWRGEAVRRPAGTDPIDVRVWPRPVQPELPVWVTSGGGRATCERAGAIGANLLTAMIRQTAEQAADNITAYRAARAAAGHDRGHVTVMMHTFVGPTVSAVQEAVRGPLSEYLATFLDLLKDTAERLHPGLDFERLTPAERESLVEHAMHRYMTVNGLFGTPTSVAPAIERFRAMGIDEIACLLDFGLAEDVVLEGLEHLGELRDALAGPEHR